MANQPRPGQRRVSELPSLLNDVIAARTQLTRERGSGDASYLPRLALLTALEDYAAALTSTGRPLPYRLRDELVLYRRLIGSGSPAGSLR